MTDLRHTIAPKSDQMNSDDLIGGTMTITVTGVSLCQEPEQPVAVNYDGDNGKPYKPCKSMRRVLIDTWGPDGKAYVGRSLTLYRDPEVAFGGMKVGGIRISHMSHIDKPKTMALTATRANKKPFTVKPLKVESPAKAQAQESAPAASQQPPAAQTVSAPPKKPLPTPQEIVDAIQKRFSETENQADHAAILAHDLTDKQIAWLARNHPDLHHLVETARAESAFRNESVPEFNLDSPPPADERVTELAEAMP